MFITSCCIRLSMFACLLNIFYYLGPRYFRRICHQQISSSQPDVRHSFQDHSRSLKASLAPFFFFFCISPPTIPLPTPRSWTVHRSTEVQVWHSGESTRLPLMWPGVDSGSSRHVGWVCWWFSSSIFAAPSSPAFIPESRVGWGEGGLGGWAWAHFPNSGW